MPTDVPSDEVIDITIHSTHMFQMCPLGPFAALWDMILLVCKIGIDKRLVKPIV